MSIEIETMSIQCQTKLDKKDLPDTFESKFLNKKFNVGPEELNLTLEEVKYIYL
jgi:hypothetical protein